MTAAAPAIEVIEATGRRGRMLQRLAALLGVVGVASALTLVAFSGMNTGRYSLPLDFVAVSFLANVTMYSIVGALIAQRRPTARVPWLLLGVGVGMGVALVGFAYGSIGVGPQYHWPFASWVLILAQLLFIPTIAMLATALLLVFPNDRLVGPAWRWVLALAAVGAALFSLGSIFMPGALELDVPPPIPNPLGGPEDARGLFELAIGLGNAFAVLSLVLGAVSIVVRYRHSDAVQAAQIRWLALVGALVAVTLPLAAAQIGPISDLSFGLGFAFLALIPVAIWVAITRYRLYEIDHLINRALVYGSLTAILAGVFTAGVGLAQRIFVAVTNQTSDAAVVGATLVVATLYAPLRKRLEAVVDRRFKFDEARFGGYRDELTKLLALTDPARATRRLIQAAVDELDAIGGAVLGGKGVVVASAGRWPVDAAAQVPFVAPAAGATTIALGPRSDARPHDERSLATLAELASLAAAAMTPGDAGRRPSSRRRSG